MNIMPEQFVVPQFLDVETKIIGPVTLRQFLIMLATVLADFLVYRIFLNIIAVIGVGIPILAIGVIFAFAKVNGRSFHFVVLSMIQTLRRPMVRVWDKALTDAQVREGFKKEEKKVELPVARKKRPGKSRLSELALVVNTGGVYNPEKE